MTPTQPTKTATSQLVQVDGYAYRWTGETPLRIGDRVMLPPNWVSTMRYGAGPFPGTVTALGSSYSGRISSILSKLDDVADD